MNTMRMRVERIDALTPAIRRLTLVSADGSPLPVATPGAHIGIDVPIDARTQRRAYSLVASTDNEYEIAVQLEPSSTGGSRWVHALEVGMELDVGTPLNAFELAPNAVHSVLIAGGIGITPILSMARALRASQASFALHYAARDAASMAYHDEVQTLAEATCWLDGGDPRNGLPLALAIGEPAPDRHLYVCGPAGLIDAALACARTLGWPEHQLHSERFLAQSAGDGADQAFEVELAASGRTLTVPADRTILEVMIEAGLDPMFDCKRGDCGVCATQVLDGDPEHRDICLSAADHDSGQFCPCVSRARSPRLVLDA